MTFRVVLSGQGRPFSVYVFLMAFALVVLAVGQPALAQQCDTRFMEAAQATAKAKSAIDVGITEQLIRKPDSVLALTCFDQAARTSAQRGGQVFSGDFWGVGLNVMVQDSMTNILTNFGGSILQLDPAYAGLFGAGAGLIFGTLGGGGAFTCTTMRDLWTNVQQRSISQLVPPMTMQDMINSANTGVMPPGVTINSELGLNIQRSFPLFNNVNIRTGALPRAIIPNYSSSTSLGSVLRCSGVSTGACP